MGEKRTVGLITIHGIENFGSLLQAYATQRTIESLGYKCEIINYKYPNEYHEQCYSQHNPYASVKLHFLQRVRVHFYYRFASNRIDKKKILHMESLQYAA